MNDLVLPEASSPPWMRWTGVAFSSLVVLPMVASGAMKIAHSKQVVEGFAQFGYPESAILAIGLAEVACALLYAFPATSVLGAILVTGYLGGAVATHVRASQPFIAPLLMGVFAWAGLFLRDPRLRALLPLRARAATVR